MRSVNNFSRYSNWSSPAVVNLSDIMVIVTTRPVPPQPQEQFPTYAYAVIAVAVLLFLAVLIVVMYLCISKVRKHYFVDIVRMEIALKFDVCGRLVIICFEAQIRRTNLAKQ